MMRCVPNVFTHSRICGFLSFPQHFCGQDDLKNPCLDYVDNIVFGPPNATFVCAGTTYTDYA